VPLPAEFVQGIDTQKIDFERGIESYARGTWSDRGWWWYYGYVLLLKEPLGVWVLTFLALLASCVFRNANASWRDELTVLVPLLLVFIIMSCQTGFSIHPRYVVPVLPLLYIFISKAASSRHWVFVLTGMLLVWIVGSSLSFYPYSMSYFNGHCWTLHILALAQITYMDNSNHCRSLPRSYAADKNNMDHRLSDLVCALRHLEVQTRT
jgi:hypothetical protein